MRCLTLRRIRRHALFTVAIAGWLMAMVVSPSLAQTPSVETDDESSPSMWQMVSDADRIVFLGDSITFDGRYVAAIQQWLRGQRPDAPPVVINMGLPSETVSGLSEDGHAGGRFPRPDLHTRLDDVLRVSRPDLIIACYGINCGIYQPLSDERFAAFRNGIQRLHDAAVQRDIAIIHVTPPSFDASRFRQPIDGDYPAVMRTYADWLRSMRFSGYAVIDLHGPMSDALHNQTSVASSSEPLQPDGVHPSDRGHAVMATIIVNALGQSRSSKDAANASEFKPVAAPEHVKAMRLLRDAFVTAAGHQRPGIPQGLPIDEAVRAADRIFDQIESKQLPAQP
ncbi:SGNH/GDSL hydrolase family protein [Crateriforma conspicua]|uniref:SGNH/GDSL hydrolase family protein n=1 Tax=Crateriforma conspicua TaxID=2527996 RepID=UPI001188B60E|nr:SGNH/GDSL hydrolase family protein [Crateriforma conspicua]QDV63762.1 GDSL-like Lipase/Acylhydrolase [Crateriforma conspicua]